MTPTETIVTTFFIILGFLILGVIVGVCAITIPIGF